MSGGGPPRPPRLRIPPDPRREPFDAPMTARDWRELAIALGAANLAMPRIDQRLDNIERAIDLLQRPEPPPTEPPRERLISHHDAEELVSAATKSERVKEVVRRYGLEQAGRVVFWAVTIVASTLLVGGVGWALHDCLRAPVTAPSHP